MYVLRLFLAGLIGFLPGPGGRSVQVFLVDEGIHIPGPNPSPCGHHSHEAVLAVRIASVIGGCVAPGRRVTRNGHDFCEWSLDGVRIYFAGLEDQQFRMRTGVRERDGLLRLHQLPQRTSESIDVSWLGNVESVIPDGGDILPGVAQDTDNGFVKARFRLDSGDVQVCHMVEYKASSVFRLPLFNFRTLLGQNERSYRQALADEVGIKVAMKTRVLSVYLEKMANKEDVAVINLRAGDNRALDVMVLNVTPARGHKDERCNHIGLDFEHFYHLVKRDNPNGEIFVPHRASRDTLAENVRPDCQDQIVRDFLERRHGFFLRRVWQSVERRATVRNLGV